MAKRKSKSKKKGKVKNAYGLCKWLSRRNGWSKKKEESCILKFKRNSHRKRR